MEKFIKQKSIDSFCQKNQISESFDWPLAKFVQKHKKKSIFFSKYGKTEAFRTESLDFHFAKNEKTVDFRNLDSVCRLEKNQLLFARPALTVKIKKVYLSREIKEIQERYSSWKNYAVDFWEGSTRGVSLVKMWNVSLVGALIFGMFIMTFIYRYLGQGALAVSSKPELTNRTNTELIVEKDEDKNRDENFENYVAEIMESYQKDSTNEKKLKEQIKEMTKGYPIEKMAPFIAKKNQIVAAFMVAIAKKESNWGKRVPVLDGKDCYNYWGYRGIRKRMGTGGHTCFDSPEDAVNTVAKRMQTLIEGEKLNTPAKLVVWKCGYDCSWDNPVAVRKWIADIDQYFKKFDEFEK